MDTTHVSRAACALAACSITATGMTGTAYADDNLLRVEVTIENRAPENGTRQTPFWVALHNGVFDSYDAGAPSSEALERIAEDGTIDPIAELFLSTDGAAGVDGVVGDAPLEPGTFASQMFLIEKSDDFRYFSYVSMVLPSNDAYIANGNPMLHSLFDDEGNFQSVDFTVFGSAVNDAGTEVNDELPENTAFFGQMEPNSGTDENGVNMDHPGFFGSLINPDEEPSILADEAFANADFSVPAYEMVRITITALPTLNMEGVCPGIVNGTVTHAEPGERVAFLYAENEGEHVIPSGICMGTVLGLDASVQIYSVQTADENGTATVSVNVGPDACGLALQAITASCVTTNLQSL